LLYGFIVSIPAILISGPVLVRFLPKVQARPIKEFQASRIFTKEEMPGLGISLFTTLLPVLIIGIATVLIELNSLSDQTTTVVEFIGNPVIALLITVLFAAYVLGIRRGKSVKEVMDIYANSIKGITMVLLIIAGSGALKQILVDSGVSQEIGVMLEGINISPLIIAWFIATVIRFTVGSATVAGLTAAGIVLPLVSATDVSPELMVLAIGSGSLMLSHLNDSGFWLFKEYFNLTIKETLSTWTVMETSIGISGLLGVLALNQLI